MRKLAILAGAIALVAISAHTWNALAQVGGVPRPAKSLSAKPSVPAARYQMFLDDGTPTRPSTSIKIKEAGQLSTKEKSSGKVKVDQSKIQSPNLLASPKVDPSLAPSTATDQDLYKVKVKFPTLTPGSESEWARVKTYEKGKDQRAKQGDDAALNAAACKMAAATGRPLPSFCRPTVQIDRTFLDRLEAERVEPFRSGPGGGFNPNKP